MFRVIFDRKGTFSGSSSGILFISISFKGFSLVCDLGSKVKIDNDERYTLAPFPEESCVRKESFVRD